LVISWGFTDAIFEKHGCKSVTDAVERHTAAPLLASSNLVYSSLGYEL
jgi:hypothetical protein